MSQLGLPYLRLSLWVANVGTVQIACGAVGLRGVVST
jgi:hypothetical protein